MGSQEQARGIAGISKSIAEMDRVTQANAASAEQSASASQEMSAQAEALQNIAQELRTMVGGGDEGSDRAQPERVRTPIPKPLHSAVVPAQKGSTLITNSKTIS